MAYRSYATRSRDCPSPPAMRTLKRLLSSSKAAVTPLPPPLELPLPGLPGPVRFSCLRRTEYIISATTHKNANPAAVLLLPFATPGLGSVSAFRGSLARLAGARVAGSARVVPMWSASSMKLRIQEDTTVR